MFNQFVAQIPDLLLKLLSEFGMFFQVFDALQHTDHIDNGQGLGMNLRAGMVPEVVHDVLRTGYKRTNATVGLGERAQVNINGVVDFQLLSRASSGFAFHAKAISIVHQ